MADTEASRVPRPVKTSSSDPCTSIFKKIRCAVESARTVSRRYIGTVTSDDGRASAPHVVAVRAVGAYSELNPDQCATWSVAEPSRAPRAYGNTRHCGSVSDAAVRRAARPGIGSKDQIGPA